MTRDEFLALPRGNERKELVRGRLYLAPRAGRAGSIALGTLVALLVPFVRRENIGRVFAYGVGYELPAAPNTIRVPYASFVRGDYLPADELAPRLSRFAPDL